MTQENKMEEVEMQDVEAGDEAPAQKTNWPAIIIGLIVALLIACLVAACVAAGLSAMIGGEESVTGFVTYRERIALPDDATVVIQIRDAALGDAPDAVVGEEVLYGPGQVPIPFEVEYNERDIVPDRLYTIYAYIEDGRGKLMFVTTREYPVITQGNPTEDVEVVLQRAGGETEPPPPPPPPVTEAYIVISEPMEGTTLDLDAPVTVRGMGGGLPEGNVVVQILDAAGNVLAQQPTTIQAPDAGTGGEGPWSVQLSVEGDVEPGTPGEIYAFATSPQDGSVIAEDWVGVMLGQMEAQPPTPSFLEITEPVEGAVLDIAGPIQVGGVGGGLPEGNVVVLALDAGNNVLAKQATILQGEDVGSGGSGTWSVQLSVGAVPGTAGRIVAVSPSPTGEGYVASAVVNVTYGAVEGGLEGTTWVLDDTLPTTEVTAVFKDGQVSGSAGCNTYSGPYVMDPVQGTIKIGPLAATMMMCAPEIMDQENQFLEAMETATRYQVSGDTLTLFYPDGTLRFEGK